MNALEEVEEAFVTFGHKDSKNTTSLGGWNDENGSFFYFTIKFPSTKFREHDKFSNGKVVRELMDKIQNRVNDFYLEYNNKTE